MAYNSYVLFKLKNPSEFVVDIKRKRSYFIEKLSINLINPCIQARYERFEASNFSGCQSPIISSFRKIGINSPSSITSPSRKERRLETGKHCTKCNEEFCKNKI